jgi:hypothetical protein
MSEGTLIVKVKCILTNSMSTYLISDHYFSGFAIESHTIELPSIVSLQNGRWANKAK